MPEDDEKQTILVTDDSIFQRKKMADIVKKGNYKVIEAENGKEAVEKYREQEPDGVLLDIIMDEMNGKEALRRILQYDADAKVVIVSGIGHDETVKEALDIGAARYIIKPIKKDKILPAINQVIRNEDNDSR